MLAVFCLDPLHFGEREIFDSTATVCRPVYRGIVKHDDVAVAGETEIELDVVHAELDGFFDRAERVFQDVSGGAAVSYAKRFVHWQSI